MTKGRLYDRTIANGGGTFMLHAANGERADVLRGYAVAAIKGTYAHVPVADRRLFNAAIHMCMVRFPYAYAVGTWVDGDIIHVDPVLVADDEDTARTVALANDQLAYYVIHENREVRL